MATQGIVSVCQEGKVVTKVIAGCDGYNAHKLARYLRRTKRRLTLEMVYEKALAYHFGSESCLVVMDEKNSYDRCDEPLSELYRETFHDPRFNPRWAIGIADHTRVVNLPSG